MSTTVTVLRSPLVFGGSAHPVLLRAVCDRLGTKPGALDVGNFENGNVFARYRQDLDGRDIFLLQSLAAPVNASIMELLVMADAARRAAAGRITAVLPFFAYGRTDSRPEPRVPITARLLADLITVAGVDRVLTINLHAPQIQGFFTLPVDELSSLEMFSAHYRNHSGPDERVVVAPHEGSIQWAKRLADRLALPLGILIKTGDRLDLLGDVAGRPVILIENEISSGGSLDRAARLVAAGATAVSAAATHAVLAPGAVRRLVESPIHEFVVTDSIPITGQALERMPMRRLSIAPLLAEAISRIHESRPLDDLIAPAPAPNEVRHEL